MSSNVKNKLVFVLHFLANAASGFKIAIRDKLLQASDSNLGPRVGQLLEQQCAVFLELIGQQHGKLFHDTLIWTVVIVIARMEFQEHSLHLQKILVKDLAWEAKAVAEAAKIFVSHPG